MYIEYFWQAHRLNKLLETIKIDPNENLNDTLMTCMNGKLTIYHYDYARTQHKKEITSVFTDYEVLSIYGAAPSEYDQKVYTNAMAVIFADMDYKEGAKKNRKNKTKAQSVSKTTLTIKLDDEDNIENE